MARVTIFYLTNCPYCRNARRALDALRAERPAYAALEIEWIEESLQSEVAEAYDYYRVPSVFIGAEKLYECSPADDFAAIKAHLRDALDQALAREK